MVSHVAWLSEGPGRVYVLALRQLMPSHYQACRHIHGEAGHGVWHSGLQEPPPFGHAAGGMPCSMQGVPGCREHTRPVSVEEDGTPRRGLSPRLLSLLPTTRGYSVFFFEPRIA
jgi:hypothetical protein